MAPAAATTFDWTPEGVAWKMNVSCWHPGIECSEGDAIWMKPGLAPRGRRFERNAMSATRRVVAPRRGGLLALTHALAGLVLAAAQLALRPAFAVDTAAKPNPSFAAPLPPARPAGPAGGRGSSDFRRANRGANASARHPAAAAKFAAGIPRADARVRTGMAKDEGNRGGGGQNLARFRPDLSGEMSLQLLPADDNERGAVAAREPKPFAPARFCLRYVPRANVLHGRREDLATLAVKPFAPIRPNETSCDSKRGRPATRENPLAQTRCSRAAAGRLHSSCEVVKRSPEGPAAAAAGVCVRPACAPPSWR
jgi:hypothetical protein